LVEHTVKTAFGNQLVLIGTAGCKSERQQKEVNESEDEINILHSREVLLMVRKANLGKI
jgi:hypothetical protein